MIIGIDIDDTITDSYEVIMNYAQKYTIEVLKREPILKEENCNSHFYTKSLHGWNENEDIDFLNQYYENVVKEVRPRTLAIKYLQKIKQEGNKIILITARWESDKFDVTELTKQWVNTNNIPCDKLIVNAQNKLIAAKQEKVDVFIDDSFSNCKMIADAGIKAYLMDSRTNKGFKDKNIERIFSWPHLYMKLKEFENSEFNK